MGCNCGGSQRRAITASAHKQGPATWSGPDRSGSSSGGAKKSASKSGSKRSSAKPKK